MQFHRIYPFVFLLLALFLLPNALELYISKQEQITLESNRLLSPYHVEVNDDEKLYAQVRDRLSGTAFWTMEIIDRNKEDIIIAFASNDYSRVNFSLSSGEMFHRENSKEAIVGNDVQTHKKNGKEWVVYQNYSYPVIGKIGSLEGSPISNYILINETVSFNNWSGRTVFFDSVDREILDEIQSSNHLPRNNMGVERWFHVSLYMKFIQITGFILMIAVSIILPFVFLRTRMDVLAIKFELGISKAKLILFDIGLLFSYYLIFLLCTIFVHIKYATAPILANVLQWNFISISISLIIYVIGASYKIGRRYS